MRRIPSRLMRFIRPMDRATTVHRAIEALPLAGLDAITGNRPVLMLAPHPDDESLGCGGCIAEACARGAAVHVAILTDGTGSHPQSRAYPPARLKKLREDETVEAVRELGLPAEHLSFLEYRDTAAPLRGAALAAAVDRLAGFARDRGIATICTTWEHDPHSDHLSAHRMAAAAARAIGARHLSYPVWGWTLRHTKWLPRRPVRGVRLDIQRHLPAKRRAIACHRSQMTGLIDDDPTGFRMTDQLLNLCDRPFEAFLEN